jgi:hypothetical protein
MHIFYDHSQSQKLGATSSPLHPGFTFPVGPLSVSVHVHLADLGRNDSARNSRMTQDDPG